MGLFSPNWKTSDKKKSFKAIESSRKITDDKGLKQVAIEAGLPDVRIDAAYRIKDPSILRELAMSDDIYVSAVAVERINDKAVLKEIALGTGAAGDRAVQKISNRDALNEIAKTALNNKAAQKAKEQLDFLDNLDALIGIAGVSFDQAESESLFENYDYSDKQTHKIIAAIVSKIKDTETIDIVLNTYMSWGSSSPIITQSARLRKVELLGNHLKNGQVLILRCKKCGEPVRYVGYFDKVLRDSWEEKGDYVCGCTECAASPSGFPDMPDWDVSIQDEPIEGDRFKLCPICMKPKSMDVRIKPLSYCINLDSDRSRDHLKHITSKYRGIYIPWKKAVW